MDPSSFFLTESDLLFNPLASDESSNYFSSSPDAHSSDDQVNFLQDPSPLTSPMSDDFLNLIYNNNNPYDFISSL